MAATPRAAEVLAGKYGSARVVGKQKGRRASSTLSGDRCTLARIGIRLVLGGEVEVLRDRPKQQLGDLNPIGAVR